MNLSTRSAALAWSQSAPIATVHSELLRLNHSSPTASSRRQGPLEAAAVFSELEASGVLGMRGSRKSARGVSWQPSRVQLQVPSRGRGVHRGAAARRRGAVPRSGTTRGAAQGCLEGGQAGALGLPSSKPHGPRSLPGVTRECWIPVTRLSTEQRYRSIVEPVRGDRPGCIGVQQHRFEAQVPICPARQSRPPRHSPTSQEVPANRGMRSARDRCPGRM